MPTFFLYFTFLSVVLKGILAFHPSENDISQQKASHFWLKQFKPFEKTGFTREMMHEARDFYFSDEFN